MTFLMQAPACRPCGGRPRRAISSSHNATLCDAAGRQYYVRSAMRTVLSRWATITSVVWPFIASMTDCALLRVTIERAGRLVHDEQLRVTV